MLRHTGRLAVHYENLSGRLYYEGETKANGEPRLGLKLLLQLNAKIADNLQLIFGEDGDRVDPLSLVQGRS